MRENINICDCTLRDGGYYTNWDFDQNLVESYFRTINAIDAITHVEIGYRSLPMKEYLGEYYYCPNYILSKVKDLCPLKEITVMLNEKDTPTDRLDEVLGPCQGIVSLIRIAVNPKELDSAIQLAIAVKAKGFKVAFNIMYMSTWVQNNEFISRLKNLEGIVDFIYMVDSFGGIYPDEIKKSLPKIKENVSIPIGFHGHNNMELALANTLTALEFGCSIVDSTITGMGRGAGNLKTELLLVTLCSKDKISLNFNTLNPIVSAFEILQKQYGWGANLAYMISGAYSLPQKDVMSWISKRRYTTESIINALQNKKDSLTDNLNLPKLTNEPTGERVIIIGGGETTLKHAHALIQYCKKYPDTILLFAGTRYVELFSKLENRQYFCLLGAEGSKLQRSIPLLNMNNVKCILEPSPRIMGTILPEEIKHITFELPKINFTKQYPDTLLTIAFQLTINLNPSEIYTFGLDGYDLKNEQQMIEVSKENQELINSFIDAGYTLTSLTPTSYQNIRESSIYSLF